MFEYSAVNWLAVVVAAVGNVVIGFIWYLPALFGRRWGELTGRSTTASPSPMMYVLTIVGSVITAYVLALVIIATGAASITDGIVVGLVAWLGLQAANQAVGGMFEGRSWSLFYINAGNGAVSMAVMGAILAAMG